MFSTEHLEKIKEYCSGYSQGLENLASLFYGVGLICKSLSQKSPSDNEGIFEIPIWIYTFMRDRVYDGICDIDLVQGRDEKIYLSMVSSQPENEGIHNENHYICLNKKVKFEEIRELVSASCDASIEVNNTVVNLNDWHLDLFAEYAFFLGTGFESLPNIIRDRNHLVQQRQYQSVFLGNDVIEIYLQ
jgi:hypothetical protein